MFDALIQENLDAAKICCCPTIDARMGDKNEMCGIIQTSMNIL